MKKNIALILITLTLFGFSAHKFYVSVTDIKYDKEAQAVQVISRYFIDDMENVIKARYGVDPKLTSGQEIDNADYYIERYLRDKFKLFANGKEVRWKYLGKEYDVDVIKVYLEAENVQDETLKSLGVYSQVLCDMYEEQQNIVHFEAGSTKESFMLHSQNDKAMLNL